MTRCYSDLTATLQHKSKSTVLRGKPTPTLCSFKLFLPVRLTHDLAGTPIRCLAHAPACSLTHVGAELPAKIVVLSLQRHLSKNRAANTLKADMCWLVGRGVSLFLWFSMGQLVPAKKGGVCSCKLFPFWNNFKRKRDAGTTKYLKMSLFLILAHRHNCCRINAKTYQHYFYLIHLTDLLNVMSIS